MCWVLSQKNVPFFLFGQCWVVYLVRELLLHIVLHSCFVSFMLRRSSCVASVFGTHFQPRVIWNPVVFIRLGLNSAVSCFRLQNAGITNVWSLPLYCHWGKSKSSSFLCSLKKREFSEFCGKCISGCYWVEKTSKTFYKEMLNKAISKDVFIFNYVYTCVLYNSIYIKYSCLWGQKRILGVLEVIGGCALPSVGGGTLTQVLQENSKLA